MLETLEDLQPRFKKIWRRKIPMQELTMLAVHPSNQKALVLTNKGLYLLQKKIFGISFKHWERRELKSAAVSDMGIKVELHSGKLQVNFAVEKLHLRQAVVERINESIKKSL